jgi:hypothetical protein
MYNIITLSLGESAARGETPEIIRTPRGDYDSKTLEQSMRMWAWNIWKSGCGYESDGPCVFIEYA